jgi:hypothetical protein
MSTSNFSGTSGAREVCVVLHHMCSVSRLAAMRHLFGVNTSSELLVPCTCDVTLVNRARVEALGL